MVLTLCFWTWYRLQRSDITIVEHILSLIHLILLHLFSVALKL
jgi:hypothetical protein